MRYPEKGVFLYFGTKGLPAEHAAVLFLCGFPRGLFPPVRIDVFLLAVFAAVDFPLLVGQKEDLVKLLLDGGDTARILAGYDIGYLAGQMQLALFYDFVILDDIDRDIVVDKAENIQM